jgi:nucleotide-binding universal stress UspA family protein
MGIRDILVHLDFSTEAESRLALAIHYARKHEAKLRGVYPISHSYYESRDIEEQANIERIEATFKGKTAAAGIASDWVCLDSSVSGVGVTEIMAAQAYYADLVIVGQTNFGSPSRNVPIDLPERLVMASGRPVLVVPYAGTFATAGDRIMIAWKTGRESVRSVNDALPCLRKARYVSIIQVSTEATSPENDPHLSQIRDYLAQHNVTAQTDQICPGNLAVGDVLLNLTCENTIDLLVIGAYAYTRRGTPALSPIARHVLKHLAVPVLMSH